MTVSIIVPIYNVSRHIEKCVRSLMEQTYGDIEYVFVDDASPDDSIALLKGVIEEYPSRGMQVKLLVHEKNKGLPAARNTGLAQVEGDYIYHCDSDDWLDTDCIREMLSYALEKRVDIVYSDWYLSFYKNERYMQQPDCAGPREAIQAMLDGSMKYNVWNKLVKRELYVLNNISFPEGRGMGEDMTMIKLFAHAQQVAYLPKAYYHYMQTNSEAFTKAFKESHLNDIFDNTRDTIAYIEKIFGNELFLKEIRFFQLNAKLPLLFSADRAMFSVWRSWFTDAHPYIKMNLAFSKRTKFIQYAAIRKQDWVVSLYNVILFRLVYGVLYR
ncbi:glycosyltransferase family 2 protein [Sphingobacterium yanglingense]|uniref:Glycosyl transferase family 2 n=1 Tax=Sphingobacterium yanglingense TaxID=1437280 RepID=A0A4R6WDY7_9SPHI|nr:glycosyltransferase family 2 protein [Sphingobacterium yanglingense]TDQ77992.1 glycosyl transferase family 2 [Sphingobacterium yanglingense]